MKQKKDNGQQTKPQPLKPWQVKMAKAHLARKIEAEKRAAKATKE